MRVSGGEYWSAPVIGDQDNDRLDKGIPPMSNRVKQ